MARTGLVLARSGSTYRVATSAGEVEAVLRGKLKHIQSEKIVVGDRVAIERGADHGTAGIVAVEPRRNVIERRLPNGRGGRPVAANLDRVLVLVSVTQPKPNLGLSDRLLVIAEANEVPAGVVLTKTDLASQADLSHRFRSAGYKVWPTSIRTGDGIDELAEEIRGQVTLLTGPSGVGKSSLLNRLQPGLSLRTGEISAKISRGKNTTVTAVMVPVERGGYLVDSPGFSDVGLWGIDAGRVCHCFPEMRALAARCKFPDCRHLTEPGCAVRAGVESGFVAPDRYESYRNILREISATPEHWE